MEKRAKMERIFFKEKERRRKKEESSLWVNKGPWWLELEAGLVCLPSERNHFTPVSRLSGFSEIKNTCYLSSRENFCAKLHVTRCEVISDWRVGWGLSILSKYETEWISSLV